MVLVEILSSFLNLKTETFLTVHRGLSAKERLEAVAVRTLFIMAAVGVVCF